jgi:hypothetical protein
MLPPVPMGFLFCRMVNEVGGSENKINLKAPRAVFQMAETLRLSRFYA